MNVYTLHEPDTGELRYIGITKGSLNARLRGHLKQKSKSYRTSWFIGLKNKNQKPQINLLHKTVDRNTACLLERFFIASARYFNFRLVNSTSGGDGQFEVSNEVKERLRAAAKAQWTRPEFLAKVTVFDRGEWKYSTKPRTEQEKKNISEKAKARYADPAYREKVLKSQQAVRENTNIKLRQVMSTSEWKAAHALGTARIKESRASAVRATLQRPETRAKLSAIQQVIHADPAYRKKMSEAAKKRWAAYRIARS